MHKSSRSATTFIIGLSFVVGACVDHNLESNLVIDCESTETVSYLNTIKPIVDGNCSRCHKSSFVGKDWTDPVQLQEHASEASRRVRLPTTHPDHMPHDPPELTLEEITSIVCWAEQGAPID